MDFSAFPHPDTHYPHPMEQWPSDVEAPVSIELGVEETEVDEVPRFTLLPDPQNARLESSPACTITMANGAAVTVWHAGDPEDNNTEERWSGNWDVYLKGDTYTRDQVLDTAHETMLQARK